MDFLQVLAKCGDEDLLVILGVIRTALNVLTFVIPIILIILGVTDLSKAVLANKEDETKKAQKMFGTRLIYAVVIFLIPTLISLLFNLLPKSVFGGEMDGYTWKDCWDEAK